MKRTLVIALIFSLYAGALFAQAAKSCEHSIIKHENSIVASVASQIHKWLCVKVLPKIAVASVATVAIFFCNTPAMQVLFGY